ncbi:MAG TPA: molybdopterin adenylyltransferase [Peptococcaceae bacterium]|nr:molybdopterin adenylyltransferase [Peptococcaceae bacterium]
MVSVGIITVSDRSSRGEREDRGGPLLARLVTENGWEVKATAVIPDEQKMIESKLIEFADGLKLDLILTTGGTGFSPRDVTPEATLAVVEKRAPGIAEAMRLESLKITPMAMLSRAEAGIRGQSIIINLPGSPKAIKECLNVVMPALGHGIEILKGLTGDCAEKLNRP